MKNRGVVSDAGRGEDRRIALALCPSLQQRAPELERYEQLLKTWQDKINLVAAQTLSTLWTRHFADSAQIVEMFPSPSVWADLGSGAGFPGLIMAILLKDRAGAEVHLIESDQRKAAFLRAVSRETGTPAIVHPGRIEAELPLLQNVEGITARALAPLSDLVGWSRNHLLKSAVGVFLKGEGWAEELTPLQAQSSFQTRSFPSRTNPNARLIAVARDFSA